MQNGLTIGLTVKRQKHTKTSDHTAASTTSTDQLYMTVFS